MRLLTWLASILLATLILLTALLGTFQDDRFYHHAYQQNGAYEQLDEEMVWLATENFQAYLTSEEPLNYFQADQAAHLEDVKGLYELGIIIARTLIALLIIGSFALGATTKRREMLRTVLKRAATITLATTILLAILALNWEWFFTVFHRLLFTGNWQFHPATLMLKLWGGKFFMLAAAYLLVKCLAASAFLFLSASIILRRSTST